MSWQWASIAAGALLIIRTGVWVKARASADRFKRGARVIDRPIKRRRARNANAANANVLTLAGVCIPRIDETKHFKLIGTTGTGKSTAIRELLQHALQRGDRALIADPDGGYRRRFYRRFRGDMVLNPFDPESEKWDVFSEINDVFDVEQLARSLLPSTEDPSANEWRAYARTFLSAVVRRCFESGHRDAGELWRLLVIAGSDELRPLVAGTPAQPFLEPDNARMFGSIRSVTGSAIAALEFVERQRARLLSVRQWVMQGHGVLFIPYTGTEIAALRSMIATWIRLAIFEAMSQPEDRDQRLWFVVDELDALGAIDGLKDALARLRKFGGRCVLGFQSIAQVSSTYGAGDAQTIVENCGNTLILRCSGSENGGTSHFASQLIGEREVRRRQISRGHDSEGSFGRSSRRSRSISEQQSTELAVLASELEQLPDLLGYFKYASSSSWLRVALARSV